MNILSRLNTETLLTCRFVCKSWLRIISDPKFCLLHNSRTPIGILVHTNPPKSISRKGDYTRMVESPNSHFHTIGYSPCFVSHNNVSKGEEVKRVKGSKIPDKLFAEGSYDCAGMVLECHPSRPPNLTPAIVRLLLKKAFLGLPRAIIKFLSEFHLEDWERTAFSLCSGHLCYVSRAKGCINNASTPFPQRNEKSSITSLKLFVMLQS